jgi:glycosyltransferase involved in cell wall biosynthesis
MNKFFSIIIPVYNGLLHNLPVCLDSIWSQPIDASLYEVICVDDCSTDATKEWLVQQQEQHPNLRIVVHTQNLRQGGARNSGMKIAEGEYIVFIDQDDYYHADALEKVYHHLQASKLDVLIVDCTYERPGKVGSKLQHNYSHREVMTGDEQIVRNSLPWAPWKFIIRRTLILDNNCFFHVKERIEDVDWVHKMIHYAQRTQYQPILFIHYIKNDTSTTMTSYCSPETMYSTISCGARLYELVDSTFCNSTPEVRKSLEQLSSSEVGLGIRNYLFCKDKVKNKEEHIDAVRGILPDSSLSLLTRWAFATPGLFSVMSNFTACFFPTLLLFYRRVKYSNK